MQAHIDDIDALKNLRIALIKFAEVINVSLAGADSDVLRALGWLENSQVPFWSARIRKCEELVSRCKEAVQMKTLFKDATGARPSVVDEMKALKKAEAQLTHAEEKLAATRAYIRKIQHSQNEYRGSVAKAQGWASAYLPEAAIKLGNLISIISEYASNDSPVDVKSMSQSVDLIPKIPNDQRDEP